MASPERADELARQLRPTRAGSALLLRATAVVEDAARAHAFAYGPDDEHSRLLKASSSRGHGEHAKLREPVTRRRPRVSP